MSERGPDPRHTLHDRDGALGVAGAGALGGIVKPAGEASPASGGEEKLPRPFGKYMLMRKLAAGGMAELFLALHRAVAGFEKLVVIKRILPQMNQDQQFIDMLLHEARVAATLSHPNIVQTFDVGEVEGTYFIAMEHIHGEDIRTIVRQMKKKNVVEFPLEHALSIVIGLCSGLAYAHDKRDLDGKSLGIVHRDISPQNIVITFSGDVKVVDFGVAKSLHAADEAKGGQLKGKVPYMSPEQAAAEEIDWRSDIFAAGVILFELTTGRRLFKGSNEYETLKLITDHEYPLPSDIAPDYPMRLEQIVMKALAKDRNKRYQSARDMQADLEAFVRDERLPVSAVQLSAWMQSLFAESLEQHKATLQDIKQLADRIVMVDPQASFTMTGVHPRFDQSSTGIAAPGASASIPAPAQRSSKGTILTVLAAAVVLGGGAFFYASRERPVVVVEPAAPSALAEPAPEPRGSLRVESKPEGAAVWLNGELTKHRTPATIDNLPLGTAINLKLSLDGYESHKESITLERSGETKTASVELQTGSVTVELDIQPPPTVWVDQKPWKGDWKKITGLSADEEHKIVVSASGYVPKSFVFTGKQGETKTFKHVMVKGDPNAVAAAPTTTAEPPKPEKTAEAPVATGPGTVRVNARGGYCNVTINGQSYGPTPVSATVPAGTARVSCKPESGATMSQAVKVDAGGTARVSFSISSP